MAEEVNPGLVPDPALQVFANPSRPAEPPFGHINIPEHVSVGYWQNSFYDPTRMEAVSEFVKLESGPLDIETGEFTGKGFPSGAAFEPIRRPNSHPDRASFEQV